MLSFSTVSTEVPEMVLIPTLPEPGYVPEDRLCASRLWSETDLGLNPGSSINYDATDKLFDF